jgi:Uma2 family endonuclease
MVLLSDLSELLKLTDPEEKFSISHASWENYETLLHKLGDSPWYRVSYLDGVIELLSPSCRHERSKKNISFLLECYLQEKQIPYYPLGSTTFRQEAKSGGLEPDESYCIHTEKDFPDLAIEVVVTSGGINKLEIYRRLSVKEVWFFKNSQFEVHRLLYGNYVQITGSQLLPHLDLTVLAQYAIADEPLKAVREFREKIRGMDG